MSAGPRGDLGRARSGVGIPRPLHDDPAHQDLPHRAGRPVRLFGNGLLGPAGAAVAELMVANRAEFAPDGEGPWEPYAGPPPTAPAASAPPPITTSAPGGP